MGGADFRCPACGVLVRRDERDACGVTSAEADVGFWRLWWKRKGFRPIEADFGVRRCRSLHLLSLFEVLAELMTDRAKNPLFGLFPITRSEKGNNSPYFIEFIQRPPMHDRVFANVLDSQFLRSNPSDLFYPGTRFLIDPCPSRAQ